MKVAAEPEDWPNEQRDICGFDIADFSAFVSAQMRDHGTQAAERVGDRLDHLFRAANIVFAANGYTIMTDIGDGLVACATAPDASPAAVIASRLADGLAAADPGLRVRVAGLRGSVERRTVLGRFPLLTGAGVGQLHRAIDAAPLPLPITATVSGSIGDRGAKILWGSLRRETILFVRLAWPVTASTIDQAASITAGCAEAHGGAIDALTHDDKGILIRLAFAASKGAAAIRCGEAVLASLAAHDIVADGGVATGTLYRGRLGWPGMLTVHGEAVNRAAKLCALGGLQIDRHVDRTAAITPPTVVQTFGRDSELAVLQGFLDAPPQAGRRAAVVGPPGLGKSHLLRQVASRLPASISLSARPERKLDALHLWDELIAATGNVADLPSGKTNDRIAAAMRLAPILSNAIVLLDDAQWADPETLRLLDRLRTLGTGPSLIAAWREGSTPLEGMDLTINLAPLADAHIRQVMASIGAADFHEAVLAGGSPLHAVQLALLQPGSAVEAGSLEAVLDARLAALDGEARATMRIIAVANRPLNRHALNSIAHRLGVPITPGSIGALIDAAFVRNENEASEWRYQPVHSLIAGRIQDELPVSAAAHLHRAVARELASGRNQSGIAGAGEIGNHWRAADDTGRAIAWHVRDGLAACARGAYGPARELLATVEAIAPDHPGPAERLALVKASRAMAAWGMGYIGEATASARLALRLSSGGLRRPGKRGERAQLASARAATVCVEAGLFSGELGLIAAGLIRSWRTAPDVADQASAVARGLAFGGLATGMLRLGWLARLLYRRAARTAVGPAVAFVHASEGVWHQSFGRWATAEACFARAEQLGQAAADPHLAEALLTLRALNARFRGDSAMAARYFASLDMLASARGNILHRAWASYGEAMSLIAHDRAEEAAQRVAGAQLLLDGLGDRQSELICLGLAAVAALRRGDADAAIDLANSAAGLARRTPPINHGSLDGYAALALVASELALTPSFQPALRARAVALLPVGIAALRRYALVFPLGRPRLALARAALALALGRPNAARRHALSARRRAAALAMAGEERSATEWIEIWLAKKEAESCPAAT